jgi:hypothetical protein
MNETPTPKPRRGCFFYGCIAGAVCLVAILVAALLALQMFKKVLNQYTDTKPAALPKVELSAAQIEAVQRRVDTFQDAVSAGRPVPPLELTSDDLNAVIASRADFQGIKDKVYLRVEGDKLNAQVSVPMEQIGLPLKGRYLNGQATFNVALHNGMLYVTPAVIEVKGKPLPDAYLEKLRRENLAGGVNENSKASIALNRLEAIEVKDGKVILIPKVEK